MLLTYSVVYSEELGVYGKTYPITEPDLLEVIQARAGQFVNSTEWDKFKQKTIARVKNYILNPPPVSGITDAKRASTHYYDPSFYLDHDLIDPTSGRLIAKQGVYNPLSYKPFLSELIFINGNNENQVHWAVNRYKTNHKKTKIILTSGKYIDLDKTYKIWFYYDQNGKYTSKLSITEVPSVVYQEGKRLRIDSIDVN